MPDVHHPCPSSCSANLEADCTSYRIGHSRIILNRYKAILVVLHLTPLLVATLRLCVPPLSFVAPPSAPTIVSFEKLNHTSANFTLKPGTDNSSGAPLTSYRVDCTAIAIPSLAPSTSVGSLFNILHMVAKTGAIEFVNLFFKT